MITFKQLLEQYRIKGDIALFKSKTTEANTSTTYDSKWHPTLREIMTKYGFSLLGAGIYGAVFGKSGYPYVIKVFRKDVAYMKWIQFALKHQDNPYIPRIRGKVVRIGSTFMAIRLEKLTESSPNLDTSTLYDAADDGDEYALQVVDFLEQNNKLLDLHAGNVMMRGNQMVVIDPFFNLAMNPDDISALMDVF
jgi:hypothetical protein